MLQYENGKINSSPKKRFFLKGKTSVFIDWANVYGWTKSLKREVDAEELFGYLKTYKKSDGYIKIVPPASRGA